MAKESPARWAEWRVHRKLVLISDTIGCMIASAMLLRLGRPAWNLQ